MIKSLYFCFLAFKSEMNWSISLQEKYTILKEKESELLASISERKYFPKGTLIIKEGKSNNDFYFIEKGFIRGFYIDYWGNENTIFLPEENFSFGAPECILNGQKHTKYNFEALTDVEVIVFNFNELEKQASKNQYFFDFYNTTLKNVVFAFILRLEAFIEESPEERYVNIDKIRPNLYTLSLRKYLASFLGISPNSLSRIRKRLGINRRKKK
ncbi:Crp/Fnr family transcriptional regulator [Capnocytophaga canimorsus]|uniref:Crp/Fnr family transcriptional regulator n=1 Tax=Capnocytophaga canimorsus TaxID=28188 RepID=UPI00384DEA0F